MLSTSSLTSLANFARWLAIASGVAMVVSIGSDFLELRLLSSIGGGAIGMDEVNANDSRQLVVAIVVAIAFLAAGIAYLGWVNAAYKAHNAMGVQGLRFTPAFAVGSHFIPFYNIFAIWKVMEDNWKASNSPNNENSGAWQGRKAPPILTLWYALWFVSGFIQRMAMRMGGKDPSIDDLTNAAWLSIVAGVIALASAFVHRKLVGDVNESLVRKINLFRRESAPAAPPQPPPMQM